MLFLVTAMIQTSRNEIHKGKELQVVNQSALKRTRINRKDKASRSDREDEAKKEELNEDHTSLEIRNEVDIPLISVHNWDFLRDDPKSVISATSKRFFATFKHMQG
jgi:hypothetical protein